MNFAAKRGVIDSQKRVLPREGSLREGEGLRAGFGRELSRTVHVQGVSLFTRGSPKCQNPE